MGSLTSLLQLARRLGRARAAALVAAACLLVPAAVLAAGTLQGTAGDDALSGTPGADSIYGLAGNDKLNGGAGDDDLDGGIGADDIHGGAGTDAVVYGDRDAPVTVTLDDVANDGQAGEGDNVHSDVEQIFGGNGRDVLQGTPGPELIDGAGGNDTIVDGGGRDRVYGGPGNDAITSFDAEADIVDCGPGSDTVRANDSDVLIGCERRLPEPRVRPLAFLFTFQKTTRFTLLAVRELPSGGQVFVRCSGGGCPFPVRRIKAKPDQDHVSLTKAFSKHPLRAGATLEVRISAPQTIGRVERFVIRKGKAPRHTIRCLSPGSSKPRKKC